MNKKSLSTIPRTRRLLDNCLKVTKELDFIRIHGSTAEEITKDIDLEKMTCLITGANSGIGLEITRCLSSRNCTVLMACRNTYAASNVAKNVCEKYDRLRFYETNLASFKSVKTCSDKIIEDNKKLDIVILNAGTFGLPWSLTDDMIETTLQVNYLSQYYLLMNLEKILAPDARVVFVSSESHRNIRWPFKQLLAPSEKHISLPEHEYTSIKAYNISKLCGILAMHYLSFRWLNTSKSVFCAHPGSFVKTRLCRNWWPYELLYTIMRPFSKTIAQAASTPIYCATSPEVKSLSGSYFKDCKRCEESDLANDFHLSFRIQDLTQDLIRNRIALSEGTDVCEVAKHPSVVAQAKDRKNSIDPTFDPGYSG